MPISPKLLRLRIRQPHVPGRRSASARCATAVLLLAALTGCVSQTVRTVDMTPPKQFQGLQAEDSLLDVGIAVLDANVPETFDEQIEQLVHPDLRRAEAQYIPYFAKNLLQSTGNWGAVRVVPRPTHAVDVTVTGKIVESDGERLVLEMTVTDARGVEWFTNTYQALASKYAYSETIPPDIDPFQANYKNLADDMLAYRESLGEETIREIRATAEMKFAREFAPDAFATHVQDLPDGNFELLRLPAPDDPMLERVRRVREREYLFIDTLDEYYANFQRNMYRPYHQWRAATYDEAIALGRRRRHYRRYRRHLRKQQCLRGCSRSGSDRRWRRTDQERRGEKERSRHAGRGAAGDRRRRGTGNHPAHHRTGKSERAPAGHGRGTVPGTAPHSAQRLLRRPGIAAPGGAGGA